MTVIMPPELSDTLMALAVQSLSQPQRRFLVQAIAATGFDGDAVPVGGDRRIINALMRRTPPLVAEAFDGLYLTQFGKAVALHLNRTGDWELPAQNRLNTEISVDL